MEEKKPVLREDNTGCDFELSGFPKNKTLRIVDESGNELVTLRFEKCVYYGTLSKETIIITPAQESCYFINNRVVKIEALRER